MELKTSTHLQQAEIEIQNLENELSNVLDATVHSHLIDFVSKERDRQFVPLWDVVGNRCDVIEALIKQSEKKEKKDEVQARIKSYFNAINPGPIASELHGNAQFHSIATQYDKVVKQLELSPTIGPIVRRYHLPLQSVQKLGPPCSIPLQTAYKALEKHAQIVQSHMKLMQSVAAGNGTRSAIRISAAVAGGVLLGPLGAIGARFLSGAFTDQSDKIDESKNRVAGSFDDFTTSFSQSMETVDNYLLYTLASLYGGLLLRIEQDLNSIGKHLADINLNNGFVQIKLNTEAHQAFLKWCEDTRAQLNLLKDEQAWVKLGDAADKALRYTLSDPCRIEIVEVDGVTSYAVIFARLRATALNAAADIAWKERRYDDACRLYQFLLEGTNLGWERLVPDPETPPESKWLVHAGLRLAIHSTRGGLNVTSTQYNQLTSLPTYMVQALARKATDNSNFKAPGEGFCGGSFAVAFAITRFANHAQIKLDLTRRIPSNINYEQTLNYWERNTAEPLPYFQFMELLKEDLESKNSAFWKWLASESKHIQRKRYVKLAATVTALVCISAAAYFIFIG